MKVRKTFASDDGNFLLIETETQNRFELNTLKNLSIVELQRLFHFVGEFLHMHGSTVPVPEMTSAPQFTQLPLPLQIPAQPVADTRKNRPPKMLADEGIMHGIMQ